MKLAAIVLVVFLCLPFFWESQAVDFLYAHYLKFACQRSFFRMTALRHLLLFGGPGMPR